MFAVLESMNSEQESSKKTRTETSESKCVDIFGNAKGTDPVKGHVGVARGSENDPVGSNLGSMAPAFQQLHDQIFWYRKELEKKEAALTSMRQNGSFNGDKNLKQLLNQFTAQESLAQQYRLNAEEARCELSASVVKLHSVESELRESEQNLLMLRMDLQQERADSKILKENNARQASLIKSLREHLIVSDNKRCEISQSLSESAASLKKMENTSKANSEELEKLRRESKHFSSEVGKLRKSLTESNENLESFYTQVLNIFNERLVNWEKHIPNNLQALLRLIRSVEEERVKLRAENYRLKNQLEEADRELKADRASIKEREEENQRLRDGHSEQNSLRLESERKSLEAVKKAEAMKLQHRDSLEQLDKKNVEVDEMKKNMEQLEKKYQAACKMVAELNAKVMSRYREVITQKTEIPQQDVDTYLKLPRSHYDETEAKSAAQDLLSTSRTTASGHQSTRRSVSSRSSGQSQGQPKASAQSAHFSGNYDHKPSRQMTSPGSKTNPKSVPFLENVAGGTSEEEVEQDEGGSNFEDLDATPDGTFDVDNNGERVYADAGLRNESDDSSAGDGLVSVSTNPFDYDPNSTASSYLRKSSNKNQEQDNEKASVDSDSTPRGTLPSIPVKYRKRQSKADSILSLQSLESPDSFSNKGQHQSRPQATRLVKGQASIVSSITNPPQLMTKKSLASKSSEKFTVTSGKASSFNTTSIQLPSQYTETATASQSTSTYTQSTDGPLLLSQTSRNPSDDATKSTAVTTKSGSFNLREVNKIPTANKSQDLAFKPEVAKNESTSLENISGQQDIKVDGEVSRKMVPSPSMNSQASSTESRQQFTRNMNAPERSFEMQRAENEFGETSWDQDAEDYRGDEYIANNTNQNNFQTSFEADLTGVSEVDNQPQHLQNSKPREETFDHSNLNEGSRPESEMLSEIENLADTCDKGVDVFAEALERALEAESKLNQHAERISEIENMVEESSSGLNRFQNIRVGFLEFLEKLAGLLNIDRIAGELGIESAQEAILRRVDQLVRRENAIISQKKCNIGVLTRKNKLLREELEGKELHMDMLRKKVAQLEEKVLGFQNIREETLDKLAKTEKSNNRLKNEVRRVKDELAYSYSTKSFVQSNPDTVGDTEKNDRVMSCANCVFLPSKEEAMKLISQMPDDMLQMYGLRPMPQKSSLRTSSRHPVSEDIQPSKRNDNEIQTDEIGAERQELLRKLEAKISDLQKKLDEANDQIQSFVHFRTMMARMLGLDPVAMNVPDYEIVSRLERLIQQNNLEQSNNAPYHPNENPLVRLSIRASKVNSMAVPNTKKSKTSRPRG